MPLGISNRNNINCNSVKEVLLHRTCRALQGTSPLSGSIQRDVRLHL